MSVINLAELIDRRVDDGVIFVSEDNGQVTVSNARVRDVMDIAQACDALQWEVNIVDENQTPWPVDEIEERYEPYRLEFMLPTSRQNYRRILTNHGFKQWITNFTNDEVVQVARLTNTIQTYATAFTSWETEINHSRERLNKSPTYLVRQFGNSLLPHDISVFITRDIELNLDCTATLIWADMAAQKLALSLVNEVDSHSGSITLYGPPKYSASIPSTTGRFLNWDTVEPFVNLQTAARWVYENSREAEMRHGLLAVELARFTFGKITLSELFSHHISAATESAKLAYQMGISKLSQDTLKSLTDLRKSVSDETSKFNDLTRQLFQSTSSASIIGLGLIAIRIANVANPLVIILTLLAIDIFVGLTIFSGYKFIQLQKKIVSDWKQKIHSYLPQDEYFKLVTDPISKAAAQYNFYAILCGIGMILLSISVLFFALQPSSESSITTKSQTSDNLMESRDMPPPPSSTSSDQLDQSDNAEPNTQMGKEITKPENENSSIPASNLHNE